MTTNEKLKVPTFKTSELPNIENVENMPECGAYGEDYFQSQYHSERDIETEYWYAVPDEFLTSWAKGSLFVSNIGRVYCSGFTCKPEKGRKITYDAHFRKIFLKHNKKRVLTRVHNIFKNNRKRIYLHQLLGIVFKDHEPAGNTIVIDHVNNNPLDNRLDNLKKTRHRDNTRKDKSGCSSNYTGVTVNKDTGRISAKINIKLIRTVSVGTYSTEKRAGWGWSVADEYKNYHPGRHLNKRFIKFIQDIVDQVVVHFGDDFEAVADEYLKKYQPKKFDFSVITPDFTILETPIVRKTKPKKKRDITLEDLEDDLFGDT